MCLYPKIIINRKYVANKKNNGVIPEMKDERVKYVPVGCTKCIECKKQKARQWQVRLMEEIRTSKNGQFVTLTFSNESIHELNKEIEGLDGYDKDNAIATLGVRRFLERWRKKNGVSVKHWLVTELGHEGTENIHLHGIIFTKDKQAIKKEWKYGFVFVGDYVNERTVNYMIKYVNKVDLKHKEYNPKILTSPGIGGNYINRVDAGLNKYKINGETKETYTTRTGHKINLPVYWRNKIYSEDERESLWLQKLDKQERWVLGTRVSIKNGEDYYYRLVMQARAKNSRLGYGNDEINWELRKYENDRRNLMVKKRIEKFVEMERNNKFETI